MTIWFIKKLFDGFETLVGYFVVVFWGCSKFLKVLFRFRIIFEVPKKWTGGSFFEEEEEDEEDEEDEEEEEANARQRRHHTEGFR